MSIPYYHASIEDREQILKAIANLNAREPSTNASAPQPAVLVGSRAAIHYDSQFRKWENPITDADWDFVLSTSRLFQFFATNVGAKSSRLTAVTAAPFPEEATQTFSDPSWHFLEVNLTIVLESGETLEFEIVDRSLSVIQNQSGAKLMELMSNCKRLITQETPIGPAIVSPLEILIALKESHSLLSTSWQKTISDLNRLKKLSAPELIDDDSVSTFLELRKEDCKLRRRSQLSATQWKLLSNLRRNLGRDLSVDGSICLLVQDSTFESLLEEEQIEYVRLECTAHLAMLQDPNSKMDLSDLAIFRAQECFVTSENYCEASRYFAVSQNVEMVRWMQDFLPSISSRCMASLRDAISESNRSFASQSSFLANTRSSKNTEEAHNEAPELTSIGEIPGDIVMEILSQVLSMNVIARFSLCSRELRRVSLQSSFWRQLSQHTFSSFLTDAKKTDPDVFPNPLTFDWKRFYNACSRAKESAVPNPPSLALLHQYNVTTNASHLLRTEATAIISAFDKVAKEELEFIARWSTVTQYSVKNESDGYDDPAWRHYCVDLRVPLPDLRVITLSFKVSEDCRMYVKGDSKSWDDSSGRPVMNCTLDVWNEDGKYFDPKLPKLSFSENWSYLRQQRDVDFPSLRSAIFARPEVWCAIMITICPSSGTILNYFKIGNFR